MCQFPSVLSQAKCYWTTRIDVVREQWYDDALFFGSKFYEECTFRPGMPNLLKQTITGGACGSPVDANRCSFSVIIRDPCMHRVIAVEINPFYAQSFAKC